MDISATTAIMALNQEWLLGGGGTGAITNGGLTSVGHTVYQFSSCWQPWTEHYCYPQWSYPVYISSPSRPIKLTLREVERLRDVAHRDANLRVILEKFTSQIEVSVSFEEH